MSLPLVPLGLADIVIDTFLYGISFVLNLLSVWFTYFPLQRRAECGVAVLNKPMFIGTITLFITVTAVIVYFKQGTSPFEYYADLSQRIFAVRTSLIMASIFAGDIMIIYRLWVVWSCQYYIIILPSICVIGVARITYQLSHSLKGKSIFAPSAQAWVICLIAWRLWYTNRHSVPPESDKYRPSSTSMYMVAARVIIMESALLYSSFLLVFIRTYGAKQHTEPLIGDCLPSVAGIAFSFIMYGPICSESSRDLNCLQRCLRSISVEATMTRKNRWPILQPISVHIVHDTPASVEAQP